MLLLVGTGDDEFNLISLLSIGPQILPSSPQLGFDTCDKLQRAERFGYVIVCSQAESGNFIEILAFGGEHDDRKFLGLPDLEMRICFARRQLH